MRLVLDSSLLVVYKENFVIVIVLPLLNVDLIFKKVMKFLFPSFQEYEEEVKAGRWFHVSDTYVAEVNIERVMKAQAYLLFYERLV